MTIRFTCKGCASVLKIKDELSGTKGRCPKCKIEFIVPKAEVEAVPISVAIEEPLALPESELPPATRTESEPLAPKQSVTDVTPPPLALPSFDDGPLALPESRADEDDDDLPPLLSQKDSSDSPVFHDSSHAIDAPVADSDEEVIPPDDGESDSISQRVALGFDDDDLDSPALLAGGDFAMPLMDSSLKADDSTSSKMDRTHADDFSKGRKKSIKSGGQKSDEAFDPLKYLMGDSKEQNRHSFPSNMMDDSDLSLTDDSDYELTNRPTPAPMKTPPPRLSASRPTPEKLDKVDLASAAKMMKKAIKDAQTDAARQHQIDAKPGFDFMLFFREFGLRGLFITLACIFGVYGSMLIGNYIVSSRLKTPPLARVRGTITLDGQPLSNATVFFEPMEGVIAGSRRERARTAIGVSNEKGEFRMMYSPADHIEGVAIGKNRVWVSHLGPKGEDTPSTWSQAAFKEENITASQSAPYNIQMESDAKKR